MSETIMLEVEMKFALNDAAVLAAKLAGWTPSPPRRDEDHYFNAPDRDFARTDEALRIRSVGAHNLITYKGPKTDSLTKTRFELELPLPDGPEAAAEWRELLIRLGYRSSGVVRKARRVFTTRRDGFEVQATIDDVDGLGTYAELEIVASEADMPRARELVLRMADELGLEHSERRSYLQLLLAKQAAPREPKILETVAGLRQTKRYGSVGFVPTMGALHAGHAALIDRARAECEYVVVSIFVNPMQFGPNEDFSRYPRTFEADKTMCQELGVDLIFVPDAKEIYPDGFATMVDVGQLGEVYEGASRPGHFRGVATAVLKLFNQVQPDVAYFGQKDGQQVAVVQQLVRDSDLPLRLVIVPTVREPDGLALSSRNRYLDATQRKQATVLAQALTAAKSAWTAGERDIERLHKVMVKVVATAPDMRLDYAAVVDPKTFAPPDEEALAIIAAKIGTTRLIDNMPLS
jgi:pantoate--beta-alanine ligase